MWPSSSVFVLIRTPNLWFWENPRPWLEVILRPVSAGRCHFSDNSFSFLTQLSWTKTYSRALHKNIEYLFFNCCQEIQPPLWLHFNNQIYIYEGLSQNMQVIDSFRCHEIHTLTIESHILIPHCFDFHRIAFSKLFKFSPLSPLKNIIQRVLWILPTIICW